MLLNCSVCIVSPTAILIMTAVVFGCVQVVITTQLVLRHYSHETHECR